MSQIYCVLIKATPKERQRFGYFFGPNKSNGYFFLVKTTKNRSNGKGHGDSNTLVISDKGGRVPRAALREAVMTKATLATIGSVNLSGLQVCLYACQGVC